MERSELTPEQEARLAADIEFLDDELIRCQKEMDELTKCNILLGTYEEEEMSFHFGRIRRQYPYRLSQAEEDLIVDQVREFRDQLEEQEGKRTKPDEKFLDIVIY